MEKDKMISRIAVGYEDVMKNDIAKQSLSSGRPRSMSMQSETFMFYSAFPNAGPLSQVSTDKNYLLNPLLEFLPVAGWTMLRSNEGVSASGRGTFYTYQIWLHPDGYMLNMNCSYSRTNKKSNRGIMSYREMLSDVPIAPTTEDGPAIIEGFDLYFSSSFTDTEKHKDFLQKFLNLFAAHIYRADKASKIGIISHDGSDYYVKNFSLEGKVPPFIHVDEHYGEGFNDFHEKMIDRVKNESKGLILFHGEPGTGKTQYIRMLLDQLTRAKKSILYVPPSFSSQLTEPQMIEFISDWVLDEDQDCILLIEDAEPLLEIRNGADGRSTGISNLLNMTDGILNDMLGLMVIATFNTSISKIDSALLRPQRLIARKEFCKITELQAHKLANALKVPFPEIDYPATLAEFYTVEKESTILIHEVKEHTNKIGFK